MLLSPLLVAVLAAAPSGFARRERPYDVAHYRIDVRLAEDGGFKNRASLRLTPTRATPTIELDAYGLNVSAVRVSDGRPVTFTVADDAAARTGTLLIKAAKPFAAKQEVVLEIDYAGQAGTAHEGLFRVEPEKKGALPSFFTHLQPTYARRFFPSNDQPDDKATTEVHVVADGRYTVLSNGRKLKDEAFAEEGQNLRRVHWEQDKPHSTYLVALAVGEFEPVEVGSAVPATIWVGKGQADRAFIARAATHSVLGFLQTFTKTKYPWAKLDQVSVPRYFWSGMENTSLVMMREDVLVLDTKTHFAGHARQVGLVAHEAAHQWFGDLVTLKGWEDTWLNEGFATYVGNLAVDNYFENDLAEVVMAQRIFVDYVREESGPRAHPLRPTGAPSAEEIFDSTSYVKGAAVLKMLDFHLGREVFRDALAGYLEKHAFGNATSAQFFAAAQAAADAAEQKKSNKKSARAPSLKAFEKSWLTQRGYPILVPETSWNGSELTVKITQRPSAAGEKGPFVFSLPVVFHRTSTPTYAVEQTVLIDKPVTTFKVPLAAVPQWVTWNKGGTALAHVWTSSVGEQAWIAGARRDPDAVWRLLSLYALTQGLADPDAKEPHRPTDAVVGALLDAVTQDPSPYVREALMRRLTSVKWKRLPLPPDFARAVLAVARRPEGLPDDAMGTIRVRRAALELLGKLDHAEGHRYLVSTLEGGELANDLNYLSALSGGVARIGDSVSLATLLSAVNGQRRRGYAFFRSAAETLGSAETPEVVDALGPFFKSLNGNAEIAKNLFYRLEDNGSVRASAKLPPFVAELVNGSSPFGDDVRGLALRLLDEVKTPEARAALIAIRDGASSQRLKDSARQVLEENFPEERPAPAKKGSSKSKK